MCVPYISAVGSRDTKYDEYVYILYTLYFANNNVSSTYLLYKYILFNVY